MFSIRGIFWLAFLALFSLPLIIETLALPADTDVTTSGNALEPRGKKALIAGGLAGVYVHRKIKKHRKKKAKKAKKYYV